MHVILDLVGPGVNTAYPSSQETQNWDKCCKLDCNILATSNHDLVEFVFPAPNAGDGTKLITNDSWLSWMNKIFNVCGQNGTSHSVTSCLHPSPPSAWGRLHYWGGVASMWSVCKNQPLFVIEDMVISKKGSYSHEKLQTLTKYKSNLRSLKNDLCLD